MKMMNLSCFIAVALLILVSCFTQSLGQTLFNLSTDESALLAFKQSITSDPLGVITKNWSTANSNTSICFWIGVSCGIKNLRVTALNVSSFELKGTIPPQVGNLTFLRSLDISSNNFSGSIPSQLSKLHRLKKINVGINNFTGEIPTWLGALSELQYMYLNNNSFSGGFPLSLLNISKLQTLDMSYNLLDGNIPDEIGNFSYLETIELGYNQLRGSIPYNIFNMSSLLEISLRYNNLSGKLPNEICDNITPNLRRLYLSGNLLYGEIPPNIYKCKELQDLRLPLNNLTGEIPREIGSLSKLVVLSLFSNDFKGTIPNEVGNLTFLQRLNLQENQLTGDLSSSTILNISSLTMLYLYGNKFWGSIQNFNYPSQLQFLELSLNNFTGFIPKRIGNVTSMEVLNFYSNNLEGELPEEIANLINLRQFSVEKTNLSGIIPPSIFNMSTLQQLHLDGNLFSGSLPMIQLPNIEEFYVGENNLNGAIPSSINNSSKLYDLSFIMNSFSGSVPDFGNLRLLRRLGLWGNNLSGISTLVSSLTNAQYLERLELSRNPLNTILPAPIGNLSSLLYFSAFLCNFWGSIPSEFGNLSSLIFGELFRNQFTGSIPSTIWKLKQIQGLNLAENRLQGRIPKEMCQLSRLGELDLSGNLLSQDIPDCLGEVQSLTLINLGSNKLNSTIPSNLWNLRKLLILNLSMNYLSGQLSSQIGNLEFINQIDFSYNQFTGEIPSLIDRCQSLEVLNLSNNKFGGSIPESLSDIKSLSLLDFSNNHLSGLIPKPFENLLLQYFNVSFNKLNGEIPNGGCFLNFTAESFLGNLDLCGNSTKFQVPPCSQNHGRSRLRSVARLIKFTVPAFISAIILVGIILIFIRRKNQKRVQQPTVLSLAEWKRISYTELEQGTNSFSETNLLGRGSFGSVFKGTLFDGLNVAVKVFNLELEGAIKSFDTETKVLSSIRHRNLVRVIGCCSNAEFKALILAYMPNGSLDKWLYFDNNCLNLVQRLDIAMDVALALEYLHHGHTFPVIHCDVKPSNILLDDDMTAHVSDFGISKLFESGEATIQTKTLATFGYAAPEYGMEGIVSAKGDVYSYGIVLLEMFTRKRPTDNMFSTEMSLKLWVIKALQENAIIDVLDPALLSIEDQHLSAKEQCASSIFELAMKCLAVSPEERINMIEAAAVLRRIKAKFVSDTTTEASSSQRPTKTLQQQRW